MNQISENEIDIAAVLRRLSRKRPALARGLEKDHVEPVSILSANEANFRERSQRVKTQQKQSCKMNGAPHRGKTCGARPYRRALPAGRRPGNVDLWTAIAIAAALSGWQIAYTNPPCGDFRMPRLKLLEAGRGNQEAEELDPAGPSWG